MLGHDLSFFDRYPTGGIVSRVLSDTQAFSKVVTMTIGVVSEIVLTVLIFAYLFTIDVNELLHERTAIAHRLSTIKRADRIVVLRAGDIIEQGTHDRLLQAGGHYAELYNAYFRHQSLDYIQSAPGSGRG